MADLKMYLTSLEPDMAQSSFSQSIGGYTSSTLLYPEAKISDTVGLYDTLLSLDSPSGAGWSEWDGITYISVNDELIQVNSITNGLISVVQRGVNNKVKVHVRNDIARGVSTRELFNNVFSDEYKQYRCISVKNESSGADPSNYVTASNIRVYLGDNSRNLNSKIKISIETPKSQYVTGVANSIISDTASGTSQLIDLSLIGAYADNLFSNAYVKILSGTNEGQGRIVESFLSATGSINFDSALSEDTNVSYEILPSPSQRIKTGVVSPIIRSDTSYFVANGSQSPLYANLVIGDNASFEQGALGINDVFYIWVERTVAKGSPVFDDNSVLINIQYDSVIG